MQHKTSSLKHLNVNSVKTNKNNKQKQKQSKCSFFFNLKKCTFSLQDSGGGFTRLWSDL